MREDNPVGIKLLKGSAEKTERQSHKKEKKDRCTVKKDPLVSNDHGIKRSPNLWKQKGGTVFLPGEASVYERSLGRQSDNPWCGR